MSWADEALAEAKREKREAARRRRAVQAAARKRRRRMRPLAMPAFGTPAGGFLCSKCGQWFALAMFQREGGRRVRACQRCIDGSTKRDPVGASRRIS